MAEYHDKNERKSQSKESGTRRRQARHRIWEALSTSITSRQGGTLQSGLNRSQSSLLEAIGCIVDDNSATTMAHYTWYLAFLDSEFRKVSQPLRAMISISLAGYDASNDSMTFLSEAAILLRSHKDLALVEMVHILEEKAILKLEGRDANLDNACQLCFIAVGLLTMLYNPVLTPDPGTLQLSSQNLEGERSGRKSTWLIYQQNMAGVSQPLRLLLRKFSSFRGPLPNPNVHNGGVYNTASLDFHNISYYTLTRVVGVRIVWINSACEHLEFSSRSSSLKLFHFPVFCAMICTKDPSTTFLDQLFKDYFDNGEDDAPERNDGFGVSSEFYKEIIYTYRLIFGQDKKSWSTFRSDYAKKWISMPDYDPLWRSLCSEPWTKHQSLFEDLDAAGPKSTYSATSDFPFLAERLMILQDHVLTQELSDWRTLWRDRRNLERFWALWGILIFGVGALLLGIVQIAIGAAQLYYAIHQNQ